MKIKNFIYAPFKLCTIILLSLFILLKMAYQKPDETIKNLFYNMSTIIKLLPPQKNKTGVTFKPFPEYIPISNYGESIVTQCLRDYLFINGFTKSFIEKQLNRNRSGKAQEIEKSFN